MQIEHTSMIVAFSNKKTTNPKICEMRLFLFSFFPLVIVSQLKNKWEQATSGCKI